MSSGSPASLPVCTFWVFQQAGLPAPQTLQMARVEHGPDAPGYAWLAELTRTLLPLMEQTGVATAANVDVDSLAARIRDEVVAKDASIVLPPFIGAWSRTDRGVISRTTEGFV